MNTHPPSAAIDAPAHSARTSAKQEAAVEGLSAHAERLLLSKVRGLATGFLDPVIGLLQRLRMSFGGAPQGDAQGDDDRGGARMDRPGGRHPGAAHPAVGSSAADVDTAFTSSHRLRSFLVYLCLMLAGGMAGGALAYEMLAKLLSRQAIESRNLEIKAAKLARSDAAAQKQIADAEQKLEAAIAEHAQSAANRQKQFHATESRLASMPGAAGKQAPLDADNCNLNARNVGNLKDCFKNLER